jgi:tyrosyl-tRNA synthetase
MATMRGRAAYDAYQAYCLARFGKYDPCEDLTEQDKDEFEFGEVKIRKVHLRVDRVIVEAGMAESNSAAKRLIAAGAVDIDGFKVLHHEVDEMVRADDPSFVLRVGKQQKRIRLAESKA